MSAQPALLPQTRSGRTFLIAAIVLGVICAAQLGALGWHLVRGASRNKASVATATPLAPGEDADAMPRADELLGAPTPAPLVPSPASAAPAATRPVVTTKDLVGQARSLRQRGDTNAALARLREAQLTAPVDPDVLAEMAVVYEQIRNPELAIELWQRIYEQGNAAGPAYYLAEMRLRSGMAVSTAAPRGAKEGGANAADPVHDQRLGLVDVTLRDEPDPTAEKRLSLKVTVKNRPGKFVDANKVSIQAFFYDSIDGRQTALTNAETAFQWLTDPAHWDESTPQTLEATYFRQKPMAAILPTSRGKKSAPEPPPPPPAPRTFAGYIVRIYYDRVLQDVRAEPNSLLQQFPAEPILGTE
jgi:tetratricopeptide (TPR) repeat protein